MEPSNVRNVDIKTGDVSKGVTEAENTGIDAGPADGGTDASKNAPRASATGVDNAGAEESGIAIEAGAAVMGDGSALAIAQVC